MGNRHCFSKPPEEANEQRAADGPKANEQVISLSCIPPSGFQMPECPVAVIVLGSRGDLPPIAAARVQEALAANGGCLVLVSGNSAEACAIEAAVLAAVPGLDPHQLLIDKWARHTEDNARWVASKLRRFGKLDQPCVLIAFPVLAAAAIDALEAHGLNRKHVHAAFDPSEINDVLGGAVDPKWVEGKLRQHNENMWAGKLLRQPKLRILVEAGSTNSGDNCKLMLELLQSSGCSEATLQRLVVVKAALMERRAVCTLRKTLRDRSVSPLPVLLPFAPLIGADSAVDCAQVGLAAEEYERLRDYSGPEPEKKHFLDLDEGLTPEICSERASALHEKGAALLSSDIERLAPCATADELTGADTVVCFGDPNDLKAPLRAAEALMLSGATLLIVSGAFGRKGPHALVKEIETKTRDDLQWRHTQKWYGLKQARPMPLPPLTASGEVDVQSMQPSRYVTEADCYLELILGELEKRGFFRDGPLGKLEPEDVSIERDS